MRYAVSFLTVIALSSAVGVMALLIIWFTESEDYCNTASVGFRCLKNGRCLKPKQVCNTDVDCPDKTDEDPMYCHDFLTFNNTIDILFWDDAEDEMIERWNLSRSNIDKKPEICEFLKNMNDSAAGVKCHGRRMNESFSIIPWNDFDKFSQTISVDYGALNTSLLTGPPNSYDEELEFPVLDKIYIDYNYIESVDDFAFCHLKTVRWFSMVNNSLQKLSPNSFCPMEKLRFLILNNNKLTLNGFRFKDMPQVGIINLEHNEIANITEFTFSNLQSLGQLNLSHNRIEFIHEDAFVKNINLTELDLSYNHLHQLSPIIFQYQVNLAKLYITGNPKLILPDQLFQNLSNLMSLNIDTFDTSQFSVRLFELAPYLDMVFFKKFSYCRLVPNARRCYPYSDGVSSNSNLLIGHSRIMVWLVGLATIFGNLAVLAHRWILRKGSTPSAEVSKILNIFVINLAISDALYGVYLIILAFKDVQFRGMYSVKAYEWGTSTLCSFIGIIALISCEVSLLILTIMSFERYLTIGASFSQSQNLNVKLTRASMFIIWVFVSILALAPAIQWQSTDNTGFYGSNGLCFPIHLDEQFPVGWQYTAFVFIGVNSCCLVFITFSYSLLFYTVKQTQDNTPLVVQNIELATRFILMVLTDMLCWVPIIMLKACVLSGHQLSQEIIGWTVIYMLPLNSAVNPILYTFSTLEVRKSMKSNLNTLLEKLEINRVIAPSSENQNPSVELQYMTRSLFGGSRSGTKRKNQDKPNTAETEDTELTHSACPTVSLLESKY